MNPRVKEVLGERAYPDLKSVPHPLDIVVVFRPPHEVPGVVEDVLALEPRPALWLQLGVVHEEAARRARAAGRIVVMDRCITVEHGRLPGRGRHPG